MVQLPSFREIHPPKQRAGCNLKMGDPWKRRFLLETIISRFDVNFLGCNFLLDLFWLGILIFWKLKEGTWRKPKFGKSIWPLLKNRKVGSNMNPPFHTHHNSYTRIHRFHVLEIDHLMHTHAHRWTQKALRFVWIFWFRWDLIDTKVLYDYTGLKCAKNRIAAPQICHHVACLPILHWSEDEM